MKTKSIFSALVPFLLIASATSVLAQNLITNPSFEAGNVAFTTQYTHSPTDLFPAQTYAILTNPNSAHASFASMGDHTTGTGKMMVVNGATGSSPVVWSQQVTVKANHTYFFSTWAANVFAGGGSPSKFVFRINGITLQPQVTLPNEAAIWQNYTTTWSSGVATTALLEIIFVSTDFGGNDSALDDLVFRETSSVSASVPVAISQAVWLEWESSSDIDYQIQSSIDLNVWIDVGIPITGTGNLMTHCEKITEPKKFFRVIGLTQ